VVFLFKMPRLASETQSIRRKSSRAIKNVNNPYVNDSPVEETKKIKRKMTGRTPNSARASSTIASKQNSLKTTTVSGNSYINDLPAEVVSSLGDYEIKMPPGYNPSDDSDDDWEPKSESKKVIRNTESDFDSDEEKEKEKYPNLRKKLKTMTGSFRNSARASPIITPNQNSQTSVSSKTGSYATIKSEKGTVDSGKEQESLVCVFCKDVLAINDNPRFHYSVHYYDESAFLPIIKPEDLKDGKVQDENGKIFKYTCPYKGCTKRKMGYKEVCVHVSTAHQILRKLMLDDERSGIQDTVKKLYPTEEPQAVKVKQEKGVAPIAPDVPSIGFGEENEEDVDDPAELVQKSVPVSSSPAVSKGTVPRTPSLNNQVKVRPPVLPKSERKSRGPQNDKIHHCLICNGSGKINKEGRNLNLGSGLHDVKFHYAVCLYEEGRLMPYVDHGQGEGKQFKELEEFGAKFKYTCPFLNCERNQGRTKPIGYKEYAIHCGAWHYQIEKWMLAEMDRMPGLKEVYDALVAERDEEGFEFEEMPEVVVEEMHTCLLCRGEDKDGRNLSFEGSRLSSLRYHYAACYYDEGVYLTKYPPGPSNMTEDGKTKDELGKEVKYKCHEKGCTLKRNMGYKEFVIHMSNEHGGLDEIVKEDKRQEIRALSDKIEKPIITHN